MSSGHPGDLKVSEFVRNLVQRESLRSRLRQELRRRVGCGSIERVHAGAEAPDRPCHGVLKQIFAPSGIKQHKCSTEFEDRDARNRGVSRYHSSFNARLAAASSGVIHWNSGNWCRNQVNCRLA